MEWAGQGAIGNVIESETEIGTEIGTGRLEVSDISQYNIIKPCVSYSFRCALDDDSNVWE